MTTHKQAVQNKLRRARRAAGFCGCGNPPAPGRKSCEACLERSRVSARKSYQRTTPAKRRLGLCLVSGCLQEAVSGRARCGYHLEKSAEIQSKAERTRRAAGRCRCGNEPDPGFKSCTRCRGRRGRYLHLWKQGLRLARKKIA